MMKFNDNITYLKGSVKKYDLKRKTLTYIFGYILQFNFLFNVIDNKNGPQTAEKLAFSAMNVDKNVL